MPSMSGIYAYLAPVMCSDDDVWDHSANLAIKIDSFVNACAEYGLRRGIHYTVKPLSRNEIEDIIQAQVHAYETRVPLAEINFRNRKSFEAFRLSGLAEETDQLI